LDVTRILDLPVEWSFVTADEKLIKKMLATLVLSTALVYSLQALPGSQK